MILCECGKFINNATFNDYTKTSLNPSTRTIGHKNCGLVFNFADDRGPKRYSSRKELKVLASRFAEKNMPDGSTPVFLLEVERLKSQGRLQDIEILMAAYNRTLNMIP
jgi:hypothetical protein